MAAYPKFGDVLFWEEFRFADGGTSDKLFIVLGAKLNKQMIGVLTTSTPHPKPLQAGANLAEGIYFIPATAKAFFIVDTFVQLWRPLSYNAAETRQRTAAGQIIIKGSLPVQIANAIRNALKQSPDITPYQLSLLE